MLRGLFRWSTTVLLVGTLGFAHAGGKNSALPYTYAALGDPKVSPQIATPPATPSYVLMGGGPDVDEAFSWMISRAGIKPGTGGRFVVIRATGTDAYNPYIFHSNAAGSTSEPVAADWIGGAALGLSSVETLVIPSVAAANHAFVNSVVANAQAVFIAGGDQSDYIRYWKGTTLDQTLRDLMARNVPIGGTSAGLAVLGQFDFAALNGTVTSTQALGDPYNKYMTLDPAPLSLTGGFLAPAALANTILDSHLDTRDRMGRLISFVARLVAPVSGFGCPGGILSSSSARGIGIGVETALLVEGSATSPFDVTARRVTNPSTSSESAVYFVRPLVAPTSCASRKPLTMANVEIRKLADSKRIFNLTLWIGGDFKSVDAIAGKLTSSPY